jgi:hypothetical protein
MKADWKPLISQIAQNVSDEGVKKYFKSCYKVYYRIMTGHLE